MGKNNLMVGGIIKSLKELDYDDLVWLYSNYIDKHGKVPTTNECTIKNNLPHSRIINKILTNSNITYNDFLNQFGKVSHVRTESKDYNLFLNKYKKISNKVGHGLTISELKNNSYGLPSAGWFVKYCPNKDVKSFDDFVIWAGFESNKLQKNKNDIIKQLVQLQTKLNRPIVKTDITIENVGFSNIVINRIWGSFSQCKKELGLLDTSQSHPKPFIYCKELLDNYIDSNNIQQQGFITWKEIENNTGINHKTYINSFNNNGISIKQYLASKHISLNPNSFGYTAILPTGEKISSSFELTFSNYLESLGYHYNIDYQRDVLYKTFLSYEDKSKINCDYVINDKYIEIAGLINNKDGKWDKTNYKTKIHINYQNKMLLKKKLLEDNNKNYLFLFPEDFENGLYKNKFYELMRKR